MKEWISERVHLYKYALYIVLYLLIFSAVGFFNLAIAELNTEVLLDPSYWVNTVWMSFLFALTFLVTVKWVNDWYMENHVDYLKITNSIKNDGINNVHDDFSDFIAAKNWHSKKETWKTKINNKLVTLNNKITAQMAQELKDGPEYYSKKTQKYIKLKTQYEELLSTKWIDENLKYKKIRYPHITPAEVITGEKKPNSTTRVVDNGVMGYAATRRFSVMFATIIMNALNTALIFIGNPFSVVILVTMIFHFLMIVVNIFTGYIAGVDAFHKKPLNSAHIRYNILIEYFGWHKNKPVKEVANEATA